MKLRQALAGSLVIAFGCGTAAEPAGGPPGGPAAALDGGSVPDAALDTGTATPEGGSGAAPALPAAFGSCPNFENGTVTFNPKSGGPRTAVVSIGEEAKTKAGPLILYWFSTGGSPTEAQRGLPISAVKAAGGIVVAPVDVANAGTFPWIKDPTLHDDLTDEIVACAAKQTMFDRNRIHTTGFSAGGLMATHLSFARSNYIASVAPYSGGTTGIFQNPANKFAAMIMVGGKGDNVFGQDFYAGSKTWQTTLKAEGHFAMLCDHGGGHSLPIKLVPAVWQFFLDHPFGSNPSAYAGGKLPNSISAVCTE
jgi:hypothetical protein